MPVTIVITSLLYVSSSLIITGADVTVGAFVLPFALVAVDGSPASGLVEAVGACSLLAVLAVDAVT
jgi:hypothetical protein